VTWSTSSHRTRIKFCGMTRAEDIAVAARLGVDAIGLIFADRSPRRLTLQQARALRDAIPPLLGTIALTMDAPLTRVREILQVVHPQWLQFHGSEDDVDCAGFGLPFLKALPMRGEELALAAMARYPHAAGFVLDAHAPGEAGGGGQVFDWRHAPDDAAKPWLLAGGLHPDNVFDAIVATRPFGVDVASGIEIEPGVKCPEKMARFVAEVRRADAEPVHSGHDRQ
jgi:phosphoribosylanthranilate isomerase